MTLKHVKWEDYIFTAEPPLPYDVTFRVFPLELEDQDQYVEVSAHKLLLASVSNVFQAQFFGPLANDKGMVEIKETTVDAFKECLKNAKTQKHFHAICYY